MSWSCPSGITLYHCETQAGTFFSGCCTIDPCKLYTCPPANYHSPSLSFSSNVAAGSSSTAALSSSNALSSLSSSPTPTTLVIVPIGAGLGASAVQSFAASTSVPSTVTTATVASQPALATAERAPKTNTAAIAGGVVGGIVGLALLVALLAICCRRRNTRPLQHMDEGRSPVRGPADARSIQPGSGAELEEIKQGQSPTSLSLSSPPLPRSPLPSPLPPPPAYTPYRSHGNELESTADLSQPSASSPYPSHDLPFPESPPSPPPLETGHSRSTADHYSDEQSVSPISTHYQHQPFGENGGPE